MARVNTRPSDAPFFNLPQARWIGRVLGMLIAVVGRDSLLGLILRQARSEIASVIQDESPKAVGVESN
jgi:hypothetical protein